MKNKNYFFTILVLILLLAGCKKEQFEKEPNDSFATANFVSLPCNIKGYLQSDNDVDFFCFDVKNKSVIDISVPGIKGVNHSIKIWKDAPSPVLLKLIDDGRKSSPERICNFFAQPGRYFVSIQHGEGDPKTGNPNTPYSLSMTARNFVDEECEPNDSIEQANIIELGRDIKGYFSPACNRLNVNGREPLREEDWFAVLLDCAQGPVVINISLSGVSGVNSVLEVYDPAGKFVMARDNNPTGLGESISSLGITQSGLWYIVVTTKGRAANHDEPYTLRVSSGEYSPTMELEPNNSIETANEIKGNYIDGFYNAPGDVDYFVYPHKGRPDFYRVSLKPDDKTDVVLTILSPNDAGGFNKAAEVNNGGTGVEEIFPNFYADDRFICVVSFASPYTEGSSYRLTVEPIPDTEGMEIEPNDTKEEADIVKGNIIKGFTSKAGDKDYFRLKYDERLNAVFEITAPKKGEIKVSVTDPMGFVLKSVKAADGKSVVLSEMVDGSCYIIVETLRLDLNNPYSIGVKTK